MLVIETLLAMLNRGVYPAIPGQGSVGASGDLAPLAHMTLAMIGEGQAYYQGKLLPAAQALEKAGIALLSLEAKEGLALINGTHLMSAIGTLTLCDVGRLSEASVVSASLGHL